MAIPYNRAPALIDTSSKAYRDNSNYFNHVQFKGLCNNQNVDSIDPNTFQEVENLYVDQDDTLSSRPKLKQHNNFGFDNIEKMWIWDDVHLIYGEKTVDNNSIVLLSDVINEVSLTLTDESLKQVVRVENRIFIFLEDKVYVYEKVEDAYDFTEVNTSNIEKYFYIPVTQILSEGAKKKGEEKNELTNFNKITIIASDSNTLNNYIPNGKEVTLNIGGKKYIVNWLEDISYLTMATPYITKTFDQIQMAPNGNAVASSGENLFYTLDGSTWEILPKLNYGNTYFGISKNGNFVWSFKATPDGEVGLGIYIISIVATEMETGNSLPVKLYKDWTLIIEPPETSEITFFDGDCKPSMDMLDCDRYICYFSYRKNGGFEDLLATAQGRDNQGNIIKIINSEHTGGYFPKQVTVKASYRKIGSYYLDYWFSRDANSIYYTPVSVNSISNTLVGNKGIVVPYHHGNGTSAYDLGLSYQSAMFYHEGLRVLPESILEENGYWFSETYPTTNIVFLPVFDSNTICMATVSSFYNNGNMYFVHFYWIMQWNDSTASNYSGIDYYYKISIDNESYVPQKIIMKDLNTFLSRFYYFNKKGRGLLTAPYNLTLPTSEMKLPYEVNTCIDSNLRQPDNSVLSFSDVMAFYVNGEVFTNPFSSTIEATYYPEDFSSSDLYTNLYPQHDVETDNTQYWSFDKNLYIEDRRYTEDWKPLLYFPEINTEIRPNQITNLLVIDRGIVAMFNEYEVWYVTKVTLEDSKTAYAYYKSRVGVGCKEGADIDIMYDGATIAYASPRGIVGMNYQQLTQNTDQILTFLSDNISTTYYPWYEDGQIKIFKYKFWTIFYKVGSYKCLVLDIRTASWWVWDSKIDGGFKEIYMYQDKPLILDNSGNLKEWDEGHEGIYKDMDGYVIDWMATSQPLTLGALNNYKRITSININNVQLTRDPFNYVLICRNYKDKRNVYSPKVVGFEQERITVGSYRTFVKRLNYIQSVKFQYTIANNSDLPIQSPISITAISTKYEIKGRIR